MTEKFSLKWNDFNDNVSKTFSSMRHQEDFYDVTLVSDDQEQFSAHKVVLSACSEYFGNILKKNKHSHPLLCLEGVSSNELNSLLDYIYVGEALVFQDDLERFLQIAQRLQLKGIKDKFPQTDDLNVDNEAHRNTKDDLTETFQLPFKEETLTEAEVHNSAHVQDASNLAKVNKKIEEFIEKEEGGTNNGKWTCKLCGKNTKRKQDLQKHVETHIEGLSFPCHICGSIFR